MCCLYRGIAAEGGLWARLEAVGMSVEMTAGVLVARMMEGMQFVLGPTMAFRREAIRRMGGFKVTADYCADDFVLGNETYKLGQTVVLSHHAIDHMVINLELHVFAEAPGAVDEVDAVFAAEGTFWNGAHVQHAVRVAGARGGRAAGTSVVGSGAAGVGVATRLALSIAVGRMVVRDPSWLNLLVLYPVRDLMGFCLLGGELLGEPDSVARTGVSVAARRKDAGGGVETVFSVSDHQQWAVIREAQKLKNSFRSASS